MQECAVLGVPDEVHGEVITALVVLKEGEPAAELAAAGDGDAAKALRAFCAETLPKYKVRTPLQRHAWLAQLLVGFVHAGAL